jgi:hypothetical protein
VLISKTIHDRNLRSYTVDGTMAYLARVNNSKHILATILLFIRNWCSVKLGKNRRMNMRQVYSRMRRWWMSRRDLLLICASNIGTMAPSTVYDLRPQLWSVTNKSVTGGARKPVFTVASSAAAHRRRRRTRQVGRPTATNDWANRPVRRFHYIVL